MKEYRIKLRELLAERNVSITQVHKDTGLSRPTLNAIKYGRSKGIQLETIDVLCNYFKITPGELFAEVQPIKPVYPQRKKAAIKKITAI
jgi:hypothetical protein|nr:MAG TPA: Cro/C1-type HTH DNA-binding domain protein [Caudoviricetes sp.]